MRDHEGVLLRRGRTGKVVHKDIPRLSRPRLTCQKVGLPVEEFVDSYMGKASRLSLICFQRRLQLRIPAILQRHKQICFT